MLKANENLKNNITKLSYKLINELFYFDDNEKKFRLCIFIVMKIKIFKLTHDEMKYFDYTRTHEKLIQNLYIYSITNKLYEFIRYCFHCQFNQTFRYKFYDSLQPIFFSTRSFHILIINFILVLPKSFDNENCVMGIINKFFKIIIFIFNKIIFDNKD